MLYQLIIMLRSSCLHEAQQHLEIRLIQNIELIYISRNGVYLLSQFFRGIRQESQRKLMIRWYNEIAVCNEQ